MKETEPKANRPPQSRVVVPPKKVVHMACRAKNGQGCGSNRAYISLMIPLGMAQGGGTVYHYRCEGCGGRFILTR